MGQGLKAHNTGGDRMKTNTIYMLGGFLVGCFIGFKILPGLSPFAGAREEVNESEMQSIREHLSRQIESTLEMSADIVAARVHFTHRAASATLTLTSEGLSEEQLASVTSQVASAVDGMSAGRVSVYDSDGKYLNLRAIQEHEQKEFWTRIAINVAKVLGILAALITLKFIIDSVGRWRGKNGEGAQVN